MNAKLCKRLRRWAREAGLTPERVYRVPAKGSMAAHEVEQTVTLTRGAWFPKLDGNAEFKKAGDEHVCRVMHPGTLSLDMLCERGRYRRLKRYARRSDRELGRALMRAHLWGSTEVQS